MAFYSLRVIARLCSSNPVWNEITPPPPHPPTLPDLHPSQSNRGIWKPRLVHHLLLIGTCVVTSFSNMTYTDYWTTCWTCFINDESFKLFQCSHCIRCNFQILDGEDSGSTSLGRFCGSTLPGLITSSSDKVRINFVTDSSVTGTGFRLEYVTNGEFHLCSVCNANFLDTKICCNWQNKTQTGYGNLNRR